MSDGMMEGYRDSLRASEEERLLERIADHVEAPSDATWHALVAQAKATDEVRGGNFSSPTNWAKDLGIRITMLLGRDPVTWAKLLSGLLNASSCSLEWGVGKRLRDASPFAGKLLVTVDGTIDGGSFGGEVNKVIRRVLKGAESHAIGKAHSLVVVDEPEFVSPKALVDA